METYQITSLPALQTFARNLLSEMQSFSSEHKGATVLAITGDLGAGKTTFVQFLALALGVTEVVTSPTFTIMKGYELPITAPFKRLVHMDAYRIESLEELRPLRFAEILESTDTLLCIEWAERIEAVLPPHAWQLTFTAQKDGTRQIEVTLPQN